MDGSGFTVVDVQSSSTAQLTWKAGGMPLVLSDATTDYIYGPTNAPVEQVTLANSAPTFMHYEQISGTWTTINAAGVLTGLWRYDSYGNLAAGVPTSSFGFAGEYGDTSTGYVNLRARWYQPQTGEFTTRDPAFGRTNQAYAYGGDEPVNHLDPTGLDSCSYNPLTWGDCVVDGVGTAVNGAMSLGSWAFSAAFLSPIEGEVEHTISQIESAQSDPFVSAAAFEADSDCATATTASLSDIQKVAAITDRLRLPDYVALEVSGGAFGLVGGAVATLTRDGGFFLGPVAGFGMPGVAGTLEAGWIDQGSEPTPEQLNGFVQGNSIELSGYIPALFGLVGPAAAEVYGDVGDWGWSSFSTQVGIGVGLGKNVALTWSYSFELSDSGPRW